MKKLLFAVFLLFPPSFAIEPIAQHPNRGGTLGGVEVDNVAFVVLAAHPKPLWGYVEYSNSEFNQYFRGPVDVCYLQDGARAVFVGTFLESTGFTPDTQHFQVEVYDNGPGVTDGIRIQTWPTPVDCEFTMSGGFVTRGNLIVLQ
ncbi:MAG TPA: hypothetical protein VJ793_10850 [Anaerolineae bacterium]|nr:hypothetical protein [Anaerolineae bacterium]